MVLLVINLGVIFMGEYDYETTLVFERHKYFWKMLNRQIIIEDKESLNVSGGFKLILFSALPTDFNTCINEYGVLKNNASGMTKIDPSLYDEIYFDLDVKPIGDGSNGFILFVDNDEENVEIGINIDDGFYIKGAALVTNGIETGGNYVVAFCRLLTPAMCKESITIADKSEFIGHDVCNEV